MANKQREQAKALYLQGISKSEIARRLALARRTVQRWADEDAWDDFKLTDPPPEPQRPKIISFERPRESFQDSGSDRPLRPRRKAGELDLLEIVEDAISDAATLIEVASASNDTKGFGGTAGGLCKLIELRLKLKPIEESELLQQLLERGLSPRELVARLREAGWGEKSA